jgi:hypothetical protein
MILKRAAPLYFLSEHDQSFHKSVHPRTEGHCSLHVVKLCPLMPAVEHLVVHIHRGGAYLWSKVCEGILNLSFDEVNQGTALNYT